MVVEEIATLLELDGTIEDAIVELGSSGDMSARRRKNEVNPYMKKLGMICQA